MKTVKILFLGNSFTYFNDMPSTLKKMVKSLNIDLFVDQVTYGGFSLSNYIGDSEEALITKEKLHNTKWDYVVLQDHSRITLDDPEGFINNIITLNKMITSIGAKAVLYCTWSYRDNTEKLSSTNLSYDAFSKLIEDKYLEANNIINGIFIPVGKMFKELYHTYPEINVLTDDDYHPNPTGSYAIASLFSQVLFSSMSAQLPKGISEDESIKIKDIIQNKVFNKS